MLVSPDARTGAPFRRQNLLTGRPADVIARPSEQLRCGAAWCRALIVGPAGPIGIDLVRPDGGDRRRIATATAIPVSGDVAALDRFEALVLADPSASAAPGQNLVLHDAHQHRTVEVARQAQLVHCRGGVLWWSTGIGPPQVWHTLDLRTL